MRIAQDPVTKLWCREDGKVLMPPCSRGGAHRHTYEWVSGSVSNDGHLHVGHRRKCHQVHRMIARAFLVNPDNLPTVDHIDRNPKNNRVDNLRWADYKTQLNNRQICEDSKAKYGVRACEDLKAYIKAYNAAYYVTHREGHTTCSKVHYASQKAKGLSKRKGPDGKWRWIAP